MSRRAAEPLILFLTVSLFLYLFLNWYPAFSWVVSFVYIADELFSRYNLKVLECEDQVTFYYTIQTVVVILGKFYKFNKMYIAYKQIDES